MAGYGIFIEDQRVVDEIISNGFESGYNIK
jgi:hypothetical protein